MRTALVAVVALVPAVAHADGAMFDLGVVRARVAVTDQTALDATLLHFAIRGDVDSYVPYLHIGAEAEEGPLSGTTTLPRGAVARLAPDAVGTPVGPRSPLGGNVLALKAVAGFHANAGMLRLGADVAAGVRDAYVSSDGGMDVAGRTYESLFELRSRVDVRVSPRWLIGATASGDLLERRDLSVGLVLSLDCTH